MSDITIHVQGMSCGHCERAVTTALLAIEGVASATADHRSDEATVTFDPSRTTPDVLAATIDGLGYETTGWR